jgi:2-haloacid dehalogenase
MWVLFDLNGTLLDPAVLLDPPELPVAALDEANMMAMITVIAGRETAFKPLFDAALRRHLQRAGRDPEEAAAALGKLAAMPAFPEVPAALRTLREAGHRLAVLTQSAVEPSEAALEQAGLREHFEHVLSAPSFGAFKPEDLAYHAALEKLGAVEAWFVAGHWWDVAGAAYAGLKTAWVSRTDLAYPDAMPAPDVTGADIAEIADRLRGQTL